MRLKKLHPLVRYLLAACVAVGGTLAVSWLVDRIPTRGGGNAALRY